MIIHLFFECFFCSCIIAFAPLLLSVAAATLVTISIASAVISLTVSVIVTSTVTTIVVSIVTAVLGAPVISSVVVLRQGEPSCYYCSYLCVFVSDCPCHGDLDYPVGPHGHVGKVVA